MFPNVTEPVILVYEVTL